MISFEAAQFCSKTEYNAGKENLMLPNELEPSALYMLMIALKKQYKQNGKKYSAAKVPSRINDVEEQDNGLYSVDMVMLDPDLKEDSRITAAFSAEGFWKSARQKQGQFVRTGYFKSYEEEAEWWLLEETTSRYAGQGDSATVHSPELVKVGQSRQTLLGITDEVRAYSVY